MNLKFHWRLLQGGETPNMTRAIEGMRRETGLPDLERQAEFCRRAEQCGIIGLLTDIGATKPDPILLSAALGMATEKIEFIVAYRSGLIPPTTFVQQLNTLSSLIQGRFSLNIVAGHSPLEQRYYGDFLSHDERYPRTEEFLAICHAFWRGDDPVNFHGKYYRIEDGRLNTPFVSKAADKPLHLHRRRLGSGAHAQHLARLLLDTPRGHTGEFAGGIQIGPGRGKGTRRARGRYLPPDAGRGSRCGRGTGRQPRPGHA